MGLIALLIALPLGLIVGILITVMYSLKKNKKAKELSTTKMVLSSLGVFFDFNVDCHSISILSSISYV